jgi:DtxR family manganese transport transcriptional regulator
MSSGSDTPTASPALQDVADSSIRAPEEQADTFEITRKAHRSEINEDYVELIADLIDQTGEARPVEIAGRMGVKQPTVTKILARLHREGLVIRRPYRAVFLTDEGRELADVCRERHRLVVSFLMALGLDEATAEQDAEGIEHHVSDRTLRVFAEFIANN